MMPAKRSTKKPTKGKRKVAQAATLNATLTQTKSVLHGKRLIDLAVRSAEKYSTKRQNWFDRFAESKPRLAAEMVDLVRDWLSNGQTRKALPQLHQLYKFCIDDCGIQVTVCTFKRWVLEQKQ